MKKIVVAVVLPLLTILPFFFVVNAGKELQVVNISIQPAFHAIPIYAAQQFGWFEELGLKVNLSIFPSGASQVKAAVQSKAWDLGIAGSVPNVIGGPQGILTIGINNDESFAVEVNGAPGITEWPPTELHPNIFACTPKSTGELLLRKCLELHDHLNVTTEHFYYAQQSTIMEQLSQNSKQQQQQQVEVDVDVEEENVNNNNNTDKDESTTTTTNNNDNNILSSSSSNLFLPKYGSLWAPNTYRYRAMESTSKLFCSGRDVDFPILGGLMVREDFGIYNEHAITKVVAAYLRGVTFMQNYDNDKLLLDEIIDISSKYHEYSGTIGLTKENLIDDLKNRPLYNLDEQLNKMKRNEENGYISEADKHYYELEDFLFEEGVIRQQFEPKIYITDYYMKLVYDDPYLRDFSYYGTNDNDNDDSSVMSQKNNSSIGLIIGVIVGCIAAILVIMYVLRNRRRQKQTENDMTNNNSNDDYYSTDNPGGSTKLNVTSQGDNSDEDDNASLMELDATYKIDE